MIQYSGVAIFRIFFQKINKNIHISKVLADKIYLKMFKLCVPTSFYSLLLYNNNAVM